jgi:hypothetical protein
MEVTYNLLTDYTMDRYNIKIKIKSINYTPVTEVT